MQGPQLDRAKVVCESPNDLLYRFEGTININDKTYSLDHNQLLLRGTSLKNTDWIEGLAVYTGHETKVMKNSSKTRTKFSKIEVQTNREIVLVFLFQILVCLVGAGASMMWT